MAGERTLREAVASGGGHAFWRGLLKRADEKENPPEAYANEFGRAVIYAELGEKTQALHSLEESYAKHDLAMTELAITAEFDGMQDDPHFQNLLRRTGLRK